MGLQAAVLVAAFETPCPGADMKKLALALIALTSLLSACVAYEPYGDRSYRGSGDRDRDGIPNRDDRRPNNPNRY